MLIPTAVSRSTKDSSSKATITAFIKSASKEAIPRAIPFVFRERPLVVAGGLWVGHFSRDQSCHGMVVRRCARTPGTKARGCFSRVATDGAGARAINCDHHRRRAAGPG